MSEADDLAHVREHLARQEPARSRSRGSRDLFEAVNRLTDRLPQDPENLELRHTLGWWHELGSAHAGGRGSGTDLALELLLPVYRKMPQAVPPRVAAAIEASAGADIRASQALWSRISVQDPDVDLDELVSSSQRAVLFTTDEDPDRPGLLHNLAGALKVRFERTAQPSDLDEAIRADRIAVQMLPAPDPRRPGWLANFATLLDLNKPHSASPEALTEVIAVLRECLAATSPTDDLRSSRRDRLEEALRIRAERSGSREDLDELVQLAREGLAETGDRRPFHGRRLSNLAGILHLRFERTGALPELDEAVGLGREAVASTVLQDPDGPMFRSNLAVLLKARFERTGALDDIDEAVTLGREASSVPKDHPDLAMCLSNLASTLNSRSERTGSLDDLDEAAVAAKTSVEATSAGEAEMTTRLSVLGSTVLARAQRTGIAADLDEALAVGKQAIENARPGHPNVALALNNYAGMCWTRYHRDPTPSNLDDVIHSAVRAVEATPSTHPDLAHRLSNLAASMGAKYQLTGAAEDLRAARETFRAAALTPDAPPSVVAIASHQWGLLSSGEDAAEAFDCALNVLPLVAPRWLLMEDAVAQLGRVSRLGRDAAAARLAVGDAEGALAAVEQARAVVFSRVLQSRGDVTELRAAAPHLAHRLDRALDVLNAGPVSTATYGGAAAGAPTHRPSVEPGAAAAGARRDAGLELDLVLEEIRALHGRRWRRFFKPPLISDLLAAADRGAIAVVNIAARRCDALLLTENGVAVLPLPELTEEAANTRTRDFLAAIDTLIGSDATESTYATAEHTVRETARWLWDSVAAPILNRLGHTGRSAGGTFDSWPRIWWVATGPLSLLPLHAAGYHASPDEELGTFTDRTVIDRVVSSSIPTVGSLIHAAARRPPAEAAQRILVVAMPETPPATGLPLAELPGAIEEAELIAGLSESRSTTILARFAPGDLPPTKASVTGQLQSHAWAHFACHAMTDPDRPTRSTLLLDDHTTNPFTVLDLTAARLPEAQLAYLSACTTARPGPEQVDEPIHFAAAAMLAGYRNVIATLWPLLDDAAPALGVYEQLMEGPMTDWTAAGAAIAVHAAAHGQRNRLGCAFDEWANLVHFGG